MTGPNVAGGILISSSSRRTQKGRLRRRKGREMVTLAARLFPYAAIFLSPAANSICHRFESVLVHEQNTSGDNCGCTIACYRPTMLMAGIRSAGLAIPSSS